MDNVTGNRQSSSTSLKSIASSGFTTFFRVKTVDYSKIENTQLHRCLNIFDLTAIGVGSTLGVGIYVVAGQVAKEHSGPAVVVSFLIAAVASIFAGFCYAEFGSRVPKTGSAYLYTYITIGELLAFVIGWSLILEYGIGAASVASGCSAYFDSLVDNRMSQLLNSTMPIHVNFLGPYPDFLAFGLTLVVTVVLAVGVKTTTTFNNIFTGLNLLNVVVAVICGAFKADPGNWSLPPHTSVDPRTGEPVTDNGGFMPFGFSGVLAGASTCFYAFVGFDAIASMGEEVRNPRKAMPIGIIASLLSCCTAYCSVSIILTMMIPYYDMDDTAALPMAFEQVGMVTVRWIISVGALAGLVASLVGALFPLPRVIYAMASDGLIFKFLAKINDRFKTPFIATIVIGVFSSLMALLFALEELVDMMSIGTLLGYTLVACSVLLLRYKVDTKDSISEASQLVTEQQPSSSYEGIVDGGRAYRQPTKRTQHIVAYSICLLAFFAMLMGLAIMLVGRDEQSSSAQYLWILFAVGAVGVVACVLVIYQQPQSQQACAFKVPFLPIMAALSVSINIILMFQLSNATWIRLGVWLGAGFLIYFGYGMWHSNERNTANPSSDNTPLLSSLQSSYKTEVVCHERPL